MLNFSEGLRGFYPDMLRQRLRKPRMHNAEKAFFTPDKREESQVTQYRMHYMIYIPLNAKKNLQ